MGLKCKIICLRLNSIDRYINEWELNNPFCEMVDFNVLPKEESLYTVVVKYYELNHIQ